VYSFVISGHSKSYPETILPDLQVTVPGDIRQQTIAYCDERPEISMSQCHKLIGYVYGQFPPSAHVPSKPLTCAGADQGMGEHALSGCRKNGLKIVIVHLATAKAHWSATHAQVINLMYARRHSYDFVSMGCPPLSGGDHEDHMWSTFDQVRANWAKPKIILDNLQQYDYVLLLDSDAYISDPSTTIEEMIQRHLQGSGKSILVPNNCVADKKGDPTSVNTSYMQVLIPILLSRFDNVKYTSWALVALLERRTEHCCGSCSEFIASAHSFRRVVPSTSSKFRS
jgi:hypothetical protein